MPRREVLTFFATPFLPVKAFALPELTTSARALPVLMYLRHHSTGADGHFDLVNTPATVVPAPNSENAMSSLHSPFEAVATRAGAHARPAWSPDSALEMRLSLTELVPKIIETFQLQGVIPGPMVLACLQAIANRADPRERWLAIFNSPLGIALAAPGRDLNTALGWILAALPPARS